MNTVLKYWAVTGTFHGSLVEAKSEGDARRMFHQAWNGESILHIKELTPYQYFNL